MSLHAQCVQNIQTLTSLRCVLTIHPKQRNHELVFLTSLMEHVQYIKVLSTEGIWSFDFSRTQMTQAMLDS
jgi:hypothetical protein